MAVSRVLRLALLTAACLFSACLCAATPLDVAPPTGSHHPAGLTPAATGAGPRRKLLLDAAWYAAAGIVQKPTGANYDIGALAQPVTHVWVDPVGGSDDAPGTAAAPLRTLTAAWDAIPSRTNLTTGYHLHLLNGTFTADMRECG